MKIGLGIDTGGTCTDGVLYDLDTKEILASAKTPTTRQDLSVGIDNVLALLPAQLLTQVETVGLSTTLATNACVENKGGRSKVIFIGVDKDTVLQTGQNFGFCGGAVFRQLKDSFEHGIDSFLSNIFRERIQGYPIIISRKKQD